MFDLFFIVFHLMDPDLSVQAFTAQVSAVCMFYFTLKNDSVCIFSLVSVGSEPGSDQRPAGSAGGGPQGEAGGPGEGRNLTTPFYSTMFDKNVL